MKPNIILYFWFKVHPAFLYPLSIVFCLSVCLTICPFVHLFVPKKTFTLAIAVEWLVFIFYLSIPWVKTLGLVQKSRLSVKVKVKYQGHSFRKNGHCGGIILLQTLFFFFFFLLARSRSSVRVKISRSQFSKMAIMGALYFFTQLTHSHTMTPFDAPGKQAF